MQLGTISPHAVDHTVSKRSLSLDETRRTVPTRPVSEQFRNSFGTVTVLLQSNRALKNGPAKGVWCSANATYLRYASRTGICKASIHSYAKLASLLPSLTRDGKNERQHACYPSAVLMCVCVARVTAITTGGPIKPKHSHLFGATTNTNVCGLSCFRKRFARSTPANRHIHYITLLPGCSR